MTPDRRRLILTGAALSLTTAFGARAGIATVRNPFGPKPEDLPLADILSDTGAPALGLAVATDKEIKLIKVSGRRRIDRDDAVSEADLWDIGSNSKAMTALAYGRLVEQGKAKWGAKLPDLFPDLSFDASFKDITIEDLLSHRSGIKDDHFIDSDWLIAAQGDPRPLRDQRSDFVKRVLSYPADGKAGDYAYANANYVIAGAAMERLDDRPFEQILNVHLFGPLKLDSAGFGAPTGAQPWGHRLVNRHLLPVNPDGVADHPPVFGPAGRVHLSLGDYARFAQVFLTDGGDVVGPQTLAHIARPQGANAATDGYGLGWQVYMDRPWADGPLLMQEGSNTFWHALIAIAPGKPLAIITVSNAETNGAEACRRLAEAAIKAYVPSSVE